MKNDIVMPSNINFFTFGGAITAEKVWEQLPEKIQTALVKIHQLGIVSPGGGSIYYTYNNSHKKLKHNLKVLFKDKDLFAMEVFANQIIQVTYEENSLDFQKFVEKSYLDTKNAFQNANKPLNRSLLGRYIILNLWDTKTYTAQDKVELASSNISLESLTGFMDENIDTKTILEFEDLPDSWLNEFLNNKP